LSNQKEVLSLNVNLLSQVL